MFDSVETCLEALRQGEIILVTDDADRENEGDCICAAEFATTENVNFMATYAKGLICMPMSRAWCEKLDLPRAKRLGIIESPTSEMPHTIHYTDLDYNNHCNSIKYLQFMLNADDSLTGIYPVRLDMNYAKEVHKGDAIRVQVQELQDAVQYCILTPSGEISCTALLTKL